MAWDDRDGRDYKKHFQCFPPEIVVKRGRHRNVRIQLRRGPRRQPCESEQWEYDVAGNMVITYPIDDDPNLLDPVPLPNLGATVQGQSQGGRAKTNSARQGGSVPSGVVGHNKRSCQGICAAQVPAPDVQEQDDYVVPGEIQEDVLPLTSGAPQPPLTQSGDEAEVDLTPLVATEWIGAGVGGFASEGRGIDYWISIAESVQDDLPAHIALAAADASM